MLRVERYVWPPPWRAAAITCYRSYLAGIGALPASIHIGDPAGGADHVRYMTNSDRGHALFASEVNLLCHPYFVNDL